MDRSAEAVFACHNKCRGNFAPRCCLLILQLSGKKVRMLGQNPCSCSKMLELTASGGKSNATIPAVI